MSYNIFMIKYFQSEILLSFRLVAMLYINMILILIRTILFMTHGLKYI